MNITVYLGANAGNDPALAEAVRELGSWIGANGHRLVYGGSRSGLMGQLAQSALDAGGTVTGVEPQFFVQQELQHDGLTELIVTKDMTERKTKMIELGDAFIGFPGGTGTLEEIAEVMSKVSLGQLDAPCILYDLNGYYDSLKALLAKMIEKGLSTPQRQQGIHIVTHGTAYCFGSLFCRSTGAAGHAHQLIVWQQTVLPCIGHNVAQKSAAYDTKFCFHILNSFFCFFQRKQHIPLKYII